MVEWKKLGEVSKIIRGKRITKGELIENGKYPVISGGITPMGFINSYNREPNTITVSQYGTAGYVDFQQSRFWANDICYSVYPEGNIIKKYLWYVLKSKQDLIYSIRNTDAIPYSLPIDTLNSISIPIPSISKQQRIVDILDTFTSSIDNLKQQIEQRRKQYDYYREKLIDVNEGPEARLITLGEIGSFEKGSGIQKKDFVEEGVGCIHYGQIHTYYGLSTSETISNISKEQAKKCKKAQCGDIIIATTSEDVEGCAKAVAWLGNHEICISGDSLVFHHKENPKFIAYLFRMNYFQKFKRGRCTGAKVTRISAKALSDYPFVLPIKSKQAEIVSNLNIFEASIRNLEEQLNLREKQYEYYRNKLLTFE